MSGIRLEAGKAAVFHDRDRAATSDAQRAQYPWILRLLAASAMVNFLPRSGGVCDVKASRHKLSARATSAAGSIPRSLLRGPTISAVAVYHGSQAKVFPQGPAFVIGTKQPSALQFGNNHLDEILATTG